MSYGSVGGVTMIRAIKKWISNVVDWFLYTLLTDGQKERISNLFSERQKELLRKLTKHGKRRQQKLYIKHVKDHLYSLGFRTRALQQLKSILKETDDVYMKRLASWELVLWYANLETEEGARKALTYIKDARNGEKDLTQLRRITVVEAECLQRTGRTEEARELILNQLKLEEHPDLYLALANLEEDIPSRLSRINQVYAMHRLQPITFSTLEYPTYDHLRMEKQSETIVDDIKVTVILPAYNAGDGLRIAVESILSQSWQNIELIIVDDCSSDDTLAIAKQYESLDERVIVKQTEQNSGPYVARNIALSIATGDFVTINDADDWSHEEKIAIQARHLKNNKDIVANTSAHARLTEDLKLYRRGTPGRYIFPNMSSIMFRRELVMEKLGYWDSVRFAADGEFKRRLIRQFGQHAFADLDSGPLSLPRQAVTSLTSSSAFGYNGFFMGARKEYVESFQHHYECVDNLYYPFPQSKRLFPVPEPMWPTREQKTDGKRIFNLIVAGDFRTETTANIIEQITAGNKEVKIGLIQLYEYDIEKPLEVSHQVRDILRTGNAQMLVYGEKITTEKLLIIDYNVLLDEQIYVPEVHPKTIELLVKKDDSIESLAQVHDMLKTLYGKEITIIPSVRNVREQILARWQEKQPFQLANEDWVLLYEKE